MGTCRLERVKESDPATHSKNQCFSHSGRAASLGVQRVPVCLWVGCRSLGVRCECCGPSLSAREAGVMRPTLSLNAACFVHGDLPWLSSHTTHTPYTQQCTAQPAEGQALGRRRYPCFAAAAACELKPAPRRPKHSRPSLPQAFTHA